MCVCVMCAGMSVWRSEWDTGLCPWSVTLHTLVRLDLSQNLKPMVGDSLLLGPAPSQTGWLTSPRTSVSIFHNTGYQVHIWSCLAFHVGARDLNSGLDI